MENIEGLKQRYEKLYPIEGLEKEVINNIESVLGVKLPDDFRRISSFYSGGGIGDISIFDFDSYTPNITNDTLRLRTVIKLPNNFVVIAEPPASIILLDTKNTPAVIWCDSTDVDKLNDLSFNTPPDTWETFSGFFLYLIEQEEEEQDM